MPATDARAHAHAPRRLVWLSTYAGQFVPIMGLLGLRVLVGAGQVLLG